MVETALLLWRNMKILLSILIAHGLMCQSSRETIVSYINSKFEFFSGKNELGFSRYKIDVTGDKTISLKELWYINDRNYGRKERPVIQNYFFPATHIKAISVSEDLNFIEFHFKNNFKQSFEGKEISKVSIALKVAEYPKEVKKERIRLKNSLVFMFRNILNGRLN